MRVKDWIKSFDALKYIVDKMEFSSFVGRAMFLDREYICDTQSLDDLYLLQESMLQCREQNINRDIENIKMFICAIKDVRGSIATLNKGRVISEIELFEVKQLAYYAQKISDFLRKINYTTVEIPSIKEVYEILDPMNTSSVSFYIYDAYSERLKDLRVQVKDCPKDQLDELYLKIEIAQSMVMQELSQKLRPFAPIMLKVIEKIAMVDYLIAATSLYLHEGMTKPNIHCKNTQYTQIFNPIVADRVKLAGGKYQCVDINFANEPVLITGANMSGKSVTLSSVALCQLLCQFGMYVTAKMADICPKQDVFLSLTDKSSLYSGLSSFGSEILSIDSVIQRVENGEDILVLIDEAARTTNPVEGVAIVSALIDIFKTQHTSALITTHYSGIKSQCRCLRVKGITNSVLNEKITVDNINKYIDYSLEESSNQDVPQEAITIARMLGVNNDFLEKAKTYINN